MAKASDIRPDLSRVSLLFKGPFGFGKTLAAASYALEGPVYLSYWDKKTPVELATFFTKKRFGQKAEQILDNITYDIYDASNAGEYLNKLIYFLSDCRYTTIINDSFTFMTQAAVNWSLNYDQKQKNTKSMKDILPDWDEYKVETSLISQCLDLSRKLPCNVIWTAHPIQTTKVDGGGGASMRVSKVNSIVSYGGKIASLAPGAFSEIYHFSQKTEWNTTGAKKSYICSFESIGDEFAKSPLLSDYIKEVDFTDKLFYEVWKEQLTKSMNIIEEDKTTVTPTTEQQTPKWKL